MATTATSATELVGLNVPASAVSSFHLANFTLPFSSWLPQWPILALQMVMDTKAPTSQQRTANIIYLQMTFEAEAFAASKRDIDRQENRSLFE